MCVCYICDLFTADVFWISGSRNVRTRMSSAIRCVHLGVASSPSYQPLTWPGTLPNLPEPAPGTCTLHWNCPEPSRTFRNLRLPPALAHTGAIWAEDPISLHCWGKTTTQVHLESWNEPVRKSKIEQPQDTTSEIVKWSSQMSKVVQPGRWWISLARHLCPTKEFPCAWTLQPCRAGANVLHDLWPEHLSQPDPDQQKQEEDNSLRQNLATQELCKAGKKTRKSGEINVEIWKIYENMMFKQTMIHRLLFKDVRTPSASRFTLSAQGPRLHRSAVWDLQWAQHSNMPWPKSGRSKARPKRKRPQPPIAEEAECSANQLHPPWRLENPDARCKPGRKYHRQMRFYPPHMQHISHPHSAHRSH